MSQNLKHPTKLLSDITTGLRDIDPRTPIGLIGVTFLDEDGTEYEGPLTWALDNISNDLFFDERGNWSEATEAKVHRIN